MDYYEILGVAKEATHSEIKKAYRSKASQLHPDREGGNTEAFQDLQKAYECLKDPKRRARYDAGEPDLSEVDIKVHVNRILRELFSMAMERQVRPGKVMETVRFELADRVSSLGMQKEGIRKKIKGYKDRMSFITLDSDGEENMYQVVLNAKIEELERSFASYGEAQELLSQVSESLSKYSEAPAVDPVRSGFPAGSQWVLSSGSFTSPKSSF